MMSSDMDSTLTAAVRPADGDDAPPRPSSPRRRPTGSSTRHPGRRPTPHPLLRVGGGLLAGALVMLGVALVDTATDVQVPVLGNFAALPAAPQEPEVVQVPAPPATPGTCLTWSRADAADTALVDCGQPHLFEQAGPVVLGDQVALPSDEVFRQLVAERCEPVVLDYLGGALDPQGRFRVGALKPSPTKWDQGDRELRCGLQTASRSGALYPIVGTVAENDQSAVEEPGTCLAIDGTRVGDPVACSGPHALETVGIVDLSDQFPDAFPAVPDQDSYLQTRCAEVAAEYAGGETVVADKGLTVYWNNMAEESWNAGSRRVNCNVAALLPDKSTFAPVTGSVTGTVTVGTEVAPPATSAPAAGQPAPPTDAAPEPGDPAAPADPGAPPSGEPGEPTDPAAPVEPDPATDDPAAPPAVEPVPTSENPPPAVELPAPLDQVPLPAPIG
jgi:hypothetical protein